MATPLPPLRPTAWDVDDEEQARLAAIVAAKRQRGCCIEPGCDLDAVQNEHCVRHNGGII